MTKLLRWFALLALPTLSFAANDTNEGPPGGYIPKIWPAAIALVLYGVSAGYMWFLFSRHGKPRYMLSACIGLTTMALGFVVRIGYSQTGNNGSTGVYIIMTLLLLLSPCAYLAQDYVLLQRLALCLPTDVARRCFLIPAQRVVMIFVGADIGTFLLQALGGSMETSKKLSTINLGKKIVLLGLGLQLASFGFFALALAIFGFRLRSLAPAIWETTNVAGSGGGKWRSLYYVVGATCVGILIRSFFRIAEFAQGFNGYLTTHEGFFYLLDAFPLWLSMTAYCFVFPPRHLDTVQSYNEQLPLGSMNAYQSASQKDVTL